jgi:hypothetical protein
MFDQRLAHRACPDDAPLVYERGTGTILGRLGNISSDGILLLCEEEFSRHRLLELTVRLPRTIRGRTELEFNAEVMWSKPMENTGQIGCGLYFRHVTEDELEVFEELIRDYVF